MIGVRSYKRKLTRKMGQRQEESGQKYLIQKDQKATTWTYREIGPEIMQEPPEKAETDTGLSDVLKVTPVVLQPGGLLVSVLGSPLGGRATKIILLSRKSGKSKKLLEANAAR